VRRRRGSAREDLALTPRRLGVSFLLPNEKSPMNR
jgi:hypothetical protein